MSRGIAAFIAGLGTGVMQQSRYQDDQARQKKRDAMEEETHTAQMDDVRRKRQMQRELTDASADAQITEGAGGVTLPASADNRDVGQPDGPTADNGQLAKGVRVGSTAFADPAAAGAAVTAANTPAARAARQGAVLAKYDPLAGVQFRAANVQAEQAEQQMAMQKFARDAASAVFGGGWSGAAKFLSETRADGNDYQVTPDGKGSVTVNQVNRQTGQARAVGSYQDTDAGRMLAYNHLIAAVKPEQAVQHFQWAQEQDLKARKETREGKESDAKAGYYDALAGKNNVLAANGGAPPKRADHFEDKEWDKAAAIDKSIVSIPGGPLGDKDVESADLRAANMRVFNQARKDGAMSPMEAKEFAATTVVRLKNLASDRVAAAQQAGQKLTLQDAIRGIIKESEKAAAASPAAAGDGRKVSPAVQAERDKDRVGILESELTKAKERVAAGDPRAQGDVDALVRELGRTGKQPLAATMGAGAPAAAPAAGTGPAITTATPKAPAQRVATGPGPELDAARAALAAAAAKLTSYGLRQRAADPQGFAAAQAAAMQAKATLARAEAAWTASVGTQRPAFVAANP